MAFEVLHAGPQLTDLQIENLERKMSIALPKPYRSFLLLHNGGTPKPDCFPIRGLDGSPVGSIHYFFGIGRPVRSNDLDWNYKMYAGRVPHELLPIAGDGSGNLICLSYKGINKGAVYFWSHDDEHSPPTYGNVYFIAETFDRFLDSIYFEDISAEIAKSIDRPIQRSH